MGEKESMDGAALATTSPLYQEPGSAGEMPAIRTAAPPPQDDPSAKVVEKATSGLKDTLKTQV